MSTLASKALGPRNFAKAGGLGKKGNSRTNEGIVKDNNENTGLKHDIQDRQDHLSSSSLASKHANLSPAKNAKPNAFEDLEQEAIQQSALVNDIEYVTSSEDDDEDDFGILASADHSAIALSENPYEQSTSQAQPKKSNIMSIGWIAGGLGGLALAGAAVAGGGGGGGESGSSATTASPVPTSSPLQNTPTPTPSPIVVVSAQTLKTPSSLALAENGKDYTVTGTADKNTTVNVYDKNGVFIISTTCDAAGHFSVGVSGTTLQGQAISIISSSPTAKSSLASYISIPAQAPREPELDNSYTNYQYGDISEKLIALSGVDQLMSGGKWGSALNKGAIISYRFMAANENGFGYFKEGEVIDITEKEANIHRNVMSYTASISNIEFIESTNETANLTYVTHKAWPRLSAFATKDFVSMGKYDSMQISPNNLYYDSYFRLVNLHELGHSLGLSHTYPTTDIEKIHNNLNYSVMSYYVDQQASIDQEYGYSGAQYHPSTFMLDDIAMFQTLYGQTTSNEGDTIYHWGEKDKIWETIFDTSGTDTIDANNQLLGVKIDLSPGGFSEIGQKFFVKTYGELNNSHLAIYYETIIENATGSSFNDTLLGNQANNVLKGGIGDDLLEGGAGSDTLMGGLGNDTAIGGIGSDTFYLSKTGVDKIVDFKSGEDKLMLDADLKTLLQMTPSSDISRILEIESNHNANTSDIRLIYDTNTSKLYYDADGSNNASSAIEIAQFDGQLTLVSKDFIL